MKKKILICDDETRFGEEWKKSIRSVAANKNNFDIVFLRVEDFKKAIFGLQERRKRTRRKNYKVRAGEDEGKIIDGASILIVDYDLISVDGLTTGEEVAYLARCYSNCGVVIGLNQFEPRVDEYFDLTLKGHPESFADVNISSNSLGRVGLWTQPWTGFRPWSWPIIPNLLGKMEARTKEIIKKLDTKIMDYLGFNQIESLYLPRSITDFISKGDIAKTTFREFVISSGQGLRPKDKAMSEGAIARIAAARIGTWLENIVLPSQNILVDAPHLVARFPSLLTKKTANIDGLNATIPLDHQRVSVKNTVDQYKFDKANWLSRQTWFWSEVINFEAIPEISNPWLTSESDLVFCEDVSKFEKRNIAQSFVADLDSPFIKRYAKNLSDVKYTPKARFSL